METVILTSALSYSELWWKDGTGWWITSDRTAQAADDATVLARFGDEAFRCRTAFLANTEAGWTPCRARMIGRRPVERIIDAGWSVTIDHETQFRAERDGVTIEAAPADFSLGVWRSGSSGGPAGGHTLDLDAVEQILVAWAEDVDPTGSARFADWSPAATEPD